MGVRGNCIFFAYKLWEEELPMANGNATIIVGSTRLGRNMMPFFQCANSYFIQFITNRLPETGLIMPWLRLFAFAERAVI